MDYFVMLYTQNGSFTPLVDIDEFDNADIAKFETEDEARESAKSNMLGEAFGYEIFEIGLGNQ